ncbi:MAG: FkbM family methyltransferase, partial [Bacteroidota bacterium]
LDVNLEMGVAEEEGTLVYHIFDRPAFNTFSHAEAERKQQSGEHPVIDRKEISVAPLAQILEQHYPYDKIDFMSVDVEGLDLPVLRSNNWRVYRPQLVFAEDLKRTNLLELPASELVVFMQSVGYVPIARLYNTLVFERSR